MITYAVTSNIKNVGVVRDALVETYPNIKTVVKVGDNYNIHCDDELTPEEVVGLPAFLETVVDASLTAKRPKIYGLAKAEAGHKHFHNINYSSIELTQSLIPLRTVEKGEVVKVDWYSKVVDSTPTDLVLSVDIAYIRHEEFALYRTTTRRWVNEDESFNEEEKVTLKYYTVNMSDAIKEGVKRRSLLVDYLQLPLLTLIKEVLMPKGYTENVVLMKSRGFLDDYRQSFDKFIENSSTIIDASNVNYGLKTIVAELQNESRLDYVEWLDGAPATLGGATTIRQYIMSELSI